MRYFANTWLLGLVIGLFLFACSERKESSKPAENKKAGSGDFVIALLPEQNVFLQKRKYRPLAEYLGTSTGITIRTKLLDSYDAIYNEMIDNKVDAAFFGSLSYIAMDSKIDIEPLARPALTDGTSTYRGVIFARRGTGVSRAVATWKGKRVALVNKSTAAGYIFPKWHLHKNGIDDFERYFRKILFTGSHDAAVIAVLKGDADIGCAKDHILDKFFQENGKLREELIILAVSAPVPSNTLGVKASSDSALKERLKSALLDLDKHPEGRRALSVLGAGRFVETKEREYHPLFDMLSALGLKPGAFAIQDER